MKKINFVAFAFAAVISMGVANAQTNAAPTQVSQVPHANFQTMTARQHHLNAVLDPYDGYAAPQS